MDKTITIEPLGFPWKTSDPFLFCAFHHDNYPKGNGQFGPSDTLQGRNLRQDFSGKDGWSMYHGTKVPGFPAHPHCGFETITIAEKGMVDHSDSLGAAGRFGNGDVQWMTAGKGVQHSEMFPLVEDTKENELLLFQIWLNLPKNKKKVPPFFKMLWKEDIPAIYLENNTEIKLIAGSYKNKTALSPAPESWASQTGSEVAIWIIKSAPHSSFTLPKVNEGTNRSLYFYKGEKVEIAKTSVNVNLRVHIHSYDEITIKNTGGEAHFLLLQGKPLEEPVVQQGPFVSNSKEGIIEAIRDFQATEYGGWPWPNKDQVHDKSKGRFALYPNGEKTYK
ncbi:pirin family protein [Aquimarina sp. ERC-38]|uniref:pirin family protein n=1 Tax=Aquimarina sp. ERC-38 TaxID=2949996 RepID=UPI00224714D9|nr:pirin family protein [Aquimarina sp. ERC-38]UZO80313.1 pirin family protein [Aquimarina sp. ERC-38]